MGREIRRVPPDWEHPRYTAEDAPDPRSIGAYRPLLDDDYEHAANAWLVACDLWRAGQAPEQTGAHPFSCRYYWEYDSPPDPDTYRARAWTAEEATAYQIYETVSEGTPVSPVFPGTETMYQWLVEHGTDPYAARRFIEMGSVPSVMVYSGPDGTRVASNYDIAGMIPRPPQDDAP